MKVYKLRLVLICFSLLSLFAFSGCKNSNSYVGESPEISNNDAVLTFAGGTWSDVTFDHTDHSSRFNDNCFECHSHTDIQEETNWDCEACHSVTDTEQLCADDQWQHDCIYGLCIACHSKPEHNGPTTCTGCHQGGAEVQSGQFVDSPVEGLMYRTSTVNSRTNASGLFYYRTGETISFYVGDVLLGQSTASATLTPKDLVQGAVDETDPSVTNICRFLLTLDVDGDPTNGITISNAIINQAVNMQIDFSVSTTAFENNQHVQNLLGKLNNSAVFTGSRPRTLCSASEAQAHLRNTLAMLALEGNTVPTARDVAISGLINGNVCVDCALTGSYAFYDADGDEEGVSTYQWYRADDANGNNEESIAGATSTTYTPVSADLSKYLLFEVIPGAATGKTPGNATRSEAVGPVVPNEAPSATCYGIMGSPCVSCPLTGNYVYADTEGDAESGSLYQWYRADDASGTNQGEISGANSAIYTPVVADQGQYLAFEVTPVAASGTRQGAAARSPVLGPIEADPVNALPTVTNISVTGNTWIGSTLTVTYTYSDFEGDPESGSTYQWYRFTNNAGGGEEAVAGATSLSYTLREADRNHYLRFEVTPAASIGRSPGNPVRSEYIGPITRNTAPTATNVNISGYRCINFQLTGNYTYSDAEGDPESGTSFRWYRANNASGSGRVPIAGATAQTYYAVPADLNQYLIFEVTPRAIRGITTGTAATAVYGPILNTAEVTGRITSAAQVDQIPFRLTVSSNVTIDVLAFERCVDDSVWAKNIPTDLFGNGDSNDQTFINVHLFDANNSSSPIHSCASSHHYVADSTGCSVAEFPIHEPRSGKNPYLRFSDSNGPHASLGTGDYIFVIGAAPLSIPDAWNGNNSAGDYWNDVCGASLPNLHNYKIIFTFY